METLGGLDLGLPAFPPVHFNSGELMPSYSGGGLMYDSPPQSRKTKFQKQLSLDETNRKKRPILRSPPMKKKERESPVAHEDEDLADDFGHIELDENKNDTEETEEEESGAKKQKRNRRVSFADSVGKELIQVKVFELPEPQIRVKPPEPELEELTLLHPLLSTDNPEFQKRFEKNHVIVEKLSLGTVNVAGRIRIDSLLPGAEPRRVAVRFTKNGWMSFTKQPARLVQSASGNLPNGKEHKSHGIFKTKDDKNRKTSQSCPSHDAYCFEIGVDRNSPAVQFYVSSADAHGKPEFEDNNEGEMYTVINPNFKPPVEDEEEEGWEAWMGGSNDWENDYY